MLFNRKPAVIRSLLIQRFVALGFVVDTRETSAGVLKVWLEAGQASKVDWAAIRAAAAEVEPLAAPVNQHLGNSLRSASRSFVVEEQRTETGIGQQLFVGVKRSTKAGARWDAGEDA